MIPDLFPSGRSARSNSPIQVKVQRGRGSVRTCPSTCVLSSGKDASSDNFKLKTEPFAIYHTRPSHCSYSAITKFSVKRKLLDQKNVEITVFRIYSAV